MSIVYSCHWNDDLETAQKHCKDLSMMELSHKLQINPEVCIFFFPHNFLCVIICVLPSIMLNTPH